MKIEDRGLVYDAAVQPENERVASFTGLFNAGSGSIFCTFQCGREKHGLNATVRIFRSRDRGRTWQDIFRFGTDFDGVRGSLTGGEIEEPAPGRLLIISTWLDRSDPKRPMFDPITNGLLPTRQLVSFSDDDGESWSPWREIPITGLSGCTNTGPLLQWRDGSIAYPFESYKRYDEPGPPRHGAWFLVSRDGGQTFGPPVLVAQDPQNRIYYWDQRVCAGPAVGEYVALFWTHDLEQKKDLNVHRSAVVASGGSLRAEPVRDTGIPGQISAPLLLPDGRLLALVVDRGKPGTITLWVSPDGGRYWPKRFVVHVHQEQALLTQGKENIQFAEYWEDMGKWSFGHPAIRLLDENRVLVAYYAGVPGCLSIHWARIELSA